MTAVATHRICPVCGSEVMLSASPADCPLGFGPESRVVDPKTIPPCPRCGTNEHAFEIDYWGHPTGEFTCDCAYYEVFWGMEEEKST